MRLLTGIDFAITTGDKSWSGTNTRVDIEIYRDNELIERLMLEPGNTPRLTRGKVERYSWEYKVPGDPEKPLHNTEPDNGFPASALFDEGIHNHLKVTLVAMGDNAWEKTNIDSTVFGGDSVEQFGAVVFVPKQEERRFSEDVRMSDDTGEGHRRWTLRY